MRPAFRMLCRGLLLLLGAVVPMIAGAESISTAETISVPEFVVIPPGTFTMGSPATEPGRRPDESQRLQVTIAESFRLATTEVTRELWTEVMGDNPGYFEACTSCPVESITWREALEFCNALSAAEGREPAYSWRGDTVVWNRLADGYRLPMEREWEYACRAGTTTAYHTGRCLTTAAANFNGSRVRGDCRSGLDRHEPVAVGSFATNDWGLHDMHGNVGEWCWHSPNDDDGTSTPAAVIAGDRPRCFRGGGWFSLDTGCRSAARFLVAPSSRYDFVGLRLAVAVD